MTTANRVIFSSRDAAILTLGRWFGANQRILPWRSEPTLYRVWISEIMLQQTQVITVLPYFERFMKRFPTVETLAAADESQVVAAWAGLGYYSRARNLHRGAKAIVAAGFPSTRESWIEIPGVGPYTAGAITSIALGHAEPILDGNVERVLARVLALRRAPAIGRPSELRSKATSGDAAFKNRLWKWSAFLVRRAHRLGVSPSAFNQALMELGATVCTFRSPRCGECPVRNACAAHAAEQRGQGVAQDYPGKKPAKDWVRLEETRHAWVVRLSEGCKLLVRRQRENEWRAGLWDFPHQAPPVGSAVLLGECHTRHVVTRHKIERTTQVWSVSPHQMSSIGSTDGDGAALAWVDFRNPELPGSASFVKSRKALAHLVQGD